MSRLSWGYLVKTALPLLVSMRLGQSTLVSAQVVVNSFIDYISASERRILKDALTFDKESSFPSCVQDNLLNVLSRFGCVGYLNQLI